MGSNGWAIGPMGPLRTPGRWLRAGGLGGRGGDNKEGHEVNDEANVEVRDEVIELLTIPPTAAAFVRQVRPTTDVKFT